MIPVRAGICAGIIFPPESTKAQRELMTRGNDKLYLSYDIERIYNARCL